MDGQLWAVVAGLVLVALVVVLMGRRLARFTIELFGLKASAEAASEAPATTSGVEVSGSKAGRDLRAHNRGPGAARVTDSEAQRDLDVRNEALGGSLDPNC